MGPSKSRKRLLIGGAVFALLLLGAAATFALSTWGEVNRVTIDRPDDVSTGLEAAGEDQDQGEQEEKPGPGPQDDEPDSVAPRGGVDVFLLVGSDSREDLDSLDGFGAFSGQRADVVMVVIRSEGEAAVLSLPRDLWIEDVCGREQRINGLLEGCGKDTNGPTLLTLTVERLIGQTIDHFAMVDLAGFQAAVDAIGGYEICVDNPVRDRKANLALPAGCTLASGEQTLAWLRSRQTQELTEDGWRVMPGMSDLARNERQRQFMIDVMGRLARFSSPQDIAATAQAVAPYVTVDSELTLVSAVDLAWTMRGLASGAVVELEVPVRYHTTPDGAVVLLPSMPLDEIVAGFLTPEVAARGAIQAAG